MAAFSACNSDLCTVKFYVGDSVVAEYNVNKGEMLDVVPDVPEREGFDGVWSVTDFDEIKDDLRVYAIYSAANYKIAFMVDGEIYAEKTLRKGSVLTDIPQVPKKVGYIGQWNVTDFTNINTSITVNAEYTAVDATVTFKVNGIETIKRFVPVGGSLNDVPEIPEISGRDLSSKWVIVEKDKRKDVDFSKIQDDITVEAYYFVTVSLEGGCDIETVEIEPRSKISSPKAGVKDGYTFMGWYTDGDFREKYDFGIPFNNNLSLYARWLKNGGDEGLIFENGALKGYNGDKKTLNVPFSYEENGQSVLVTSVAENAFASTDIEEIILPSTVTVIEKGAFSDCGPLRKIGFADGNYLERVEESAFENCVSLANFGLSEFTVYIGKKAFYNCSFMQAYEGLESSAIKEIGESAFAKNTSVKQFVLPAALTVINASAFEGDGAATFDFSLLKLLETVGNRAFKDCVRLVKFSVQSLINIEERAFEGCYGMTAATIPCDVPVYKLFGDRMVEGFYGVTADGVTYAVPTMLRKVTVTAGDGDKDKNLPAGQLASDAFLNCRFVKEVELIAGVKKISEGAFRTDELTDGRLSVALPSTLTEIEERAFVTRNDLYSLSLPNALREIGAYAFNGVSELTNVEIGLNNALAYIGEGAFTGTKWLENSQGVAKVGRIAVGVSDDYLAKTRLDKLVARDFEGADTVAPYAFYGNARLVSVELGQIKSVGDYAFANMSALNELSVNPTCGAFGVGVLSGSLKIEALSLGASKRAEELFGTEEMNGCYAVVRAENTYYVSQSLKKLTLINDGDGEECAIKSGAFADFATLEEIVIGEGITAVYDGAFENSTSLKTVTLPSSLKDLGVRVKADARAETGEEADGEAEEEEYIGVFAGSILERVIMAENGNLERIFPNAFANTVLPEFNVPKSVVYIGKSAFENTALSALTFEEGDKPLEIGERAFYGADGFIGFKLVTPDRLVAIGGEAFKNCGGITGVTFKSGIKKIGSYAFENCGITAFTLPKGVESYLDGECALKGAIKGNPVAQLTLFDPIKLTDLFDGAAPNTLIRVNAYGADVADGQFENAQSVQKLELFGTETIGNNAFRGCSSLMSVVIPATVTRIGEYAFADCTSLNNFSFEIDSKLEAVEEYLFGRDTELRTVFFPKSVTGTEFIGVFDGCENLVSANIPESVIDIGENAFRSNARLTEITIPEGVRTIGASAFENCATLELRNVSFPLLTSIGEKAFAGCVKLKGFNAESVENIGEMAYDGCVNMQSITVLDKRVGDYINDVSHIRSVTISKNALDLADGVFEGCDALVFANVFVEGAATDGIAAKLINEVGSSGVKIFLTEKGYGSVTDGVKAQGEGILYVNPTEINGSYELNHETKTATLTKAAVSGAVLYVPAYIYNEGVEYAVTEIGRSVFGGNKAIKEVVIPRTVEIIGSDAFRGSSVERVVFESGSRIKSVLNNAFYGCGNIKEMELPDSLERIEEGAFYGAEELSVIVSSSFGKLAYIGKYAFYGTKKLTEMKFYGKELTVGENAFERSGLVNIEFAETLEKLTLGANSFAYCEDLIVPELPTGAEVHETAFIR